MVQSYCRRDREGLRGISPIINELGYAYWKHGGKGMEDNTSMLADVQKQTRSTHVSTMANDYPPCNYVQNGRDGKSKQFPIPTTRKTPKVFPMKNDMGKRQESNAKRFAVSQVTRSLR